ncbi:ESCRT-II complex subunit-domain-containing protein [Phakopsora pachyrhizi]|uniref:Vacuolar protein-sorting-associated protein 25 n=1 Tax=Phakopsora pachyrhizi TaxID=170000 RepID=A0AAV0AYK1_PHAPC|nr:ESCRT-II complex subunit-domain-containing protein [Phakopsora pachyrhizi]CAH7674787.1 ESCRT-II complex subunit-domain-containing protein [Phakopsora pachyrhizi]
MNQQIETNRNQQPSTSNNQINKNTQLNLKSITSSTGFKFPSIYSFPPFFTKQPNQSTWSHQSSLWQDLIRSYCKFNRIFKIELNDSIIEDLELFNNRTISRKLNLETLISIFDLMVQNGQAEYYPNRSALNQPNSKLQPTFVLIYFSSLSNWSNQIYDYILSNGLTNSIMTFNELIEIEDLQLTGIDAVVLKKILNCLVKGNKAKIFKGSSDGVGGENEGIKFF